MHPLGAFSAKSGVSSFPCDVGTLIMKKGLGALADILLGDAHIRSILALGGLGFRACVRSMHAGFGIQCV